MTPMIVKRQETRVSNWVRLVAKEVQFAPGARPEVYHCFAQSDYVTILARTPDGRIPIVRQYRPAVEAYTWEFPAGLLEAGEDPERCCRRELKEEAGLDATRVTYLGSYYADTGRLENRLHAFVVAASAPDPGFTPEAGMSVRFVDDETLDRQIVDGEFRHQLHIALLTIARVNGFGTNRP